MSEYFAPCWACHSTSECFSGCLCLKCIDPDGYASWRQENPDEYEAWIEQQRDPEAALKKLKTVAHRLSWQFIDLLNYRDRLRADIAQPPPRWWSEAEQRGDLMPWADRIREWSWRLPRVERQLASHQTRLTRLDCQLAELLAIIAAHDAREAHEDAVHMRGRKNGYVKRLRPNLKPPVKQFGLGW